MIFAIKKSSLNFLYRSESVTVIYKEVLAVAFSCSIFYICSIFLNNQAGDNNGYHGILA